MKITSRQKPKTDPLQEGSKYLAYVQSEILERQHRKNAIPGSVKLCVTIQGGQVITEIGWIELDGTTQVQYYVETIHDVLED